jgi:cell division protein FtsL
LEVIRKEYPQLQPERREKPTPKKKGMPQKSYRLEKAAVALSICGLLVLSLFLLLRYAAITELRHHVHAQNNTLEQMEMQREKLKIELERVSKSRAIEQEALERLKMQYPSPENTQYIVINQTKVDLLTNELNNRIKLEENLEQPRISPLKRVVHKFTALLNF